MAISHRMQLAVECHEGRAVPNFTPWPAILSNGHLPMRTLLVLSAFLSLVLWGARVDGDSTGNGANEPGAVEDSKPVWTVLDPHELKAVKGTTLTKQADRSILASGTNPIDEDYTIAAHTSLKGITAIRLELLPDSSLPANGPGRSAVNGNLVLNEFKVKAAPQNKPEQAHAIELRKATADFSQQNFEIETVLSGKSNPQTGGWAISPQEGRKHAAVFELEDPIKDAGGTTLTITLGHRHGNRDFIHNIGRFRLSVTTTKAPFPFWEGLKSLVWTTLDPHQLKSVRGSTLTKEEDDSVFASGANPTPETYTIQAHTRLKGITAIRLEALTDARLPQNGPGRAFNGNFVLNKFQVQAVPRNEPGKTQAIALKTATANFSQVNFGVQTILEGNAPQIGGWAVDPQQGRKHVAVFELKTPLSHQEGTTLTFTLIQEHNGTQQHNIGRFRFSVTTSKPPFPFELLDLTADDMESFWADLGSADDDRANQAAENLFQSGRAVPFLKTHMKPETVKVDAKQLARWIADLNDNSFYVRQNASDQLSKLGPLAAPALMRAVKIAPSLEARRRMEKLLEMLKGAPEVVRPQRAVDILVRVASPQACQLLASLAKGAPDAVLTEAAKSALPRLDESPP